MSKEYTAVVDFGTQKITVAVGYMSRNGLCVVGSGETEYGGYMDGEFLEVDRLGESIQNAIVVAQNNSEIEINSIVVGVPTAFAAVMTKDVVQNYNKKVRISKNTLESLYQTGNDFSKYSSYTLISSDALEFVLDDGVARVECLGMTTTKLKAKVGYVLADNKFVNLISEITRILGIDVERFISSALAEYKYLVSQTLSTSIIIDCGHLSTSIAFAKGNGIEAIAEFSLGGGFITSDLMKYLKTSYELADALKRKIVLSIKPSEDEMYEIKSGGEVVSMPALISNEIVSYRVEKIAKAVNQCFEKYGDIIDKDFKVYLCGGGLSYIKGAKEIFSKMIGSKVEIICPDIPQLARPHYSAVLSLLYVACNNNTSRRFLFFKF